MNSNKSLKPKILHLLDASLPNLSGYSIRSHNILLYQNKYVLSFALTSPSFRQKKIPDIIENIIYFRYPPNKVYNFFFKFKILNKLKISKIFEMVYYSILKIPLIYLKKAVDVLKPNIIHGHSTAKFAKFGEKIARKKKIPFIYEVRGFVEDTLVEQGFIRHNSYKYLKRRVQENSLMNRAKIVITLGKAMRYDLIKRGIDREKIFIVPNGVNTNNLSPMKPDLTLKKNLGLHGKVVIGYVGSIRKIEGLETLFKAVKIVKQKIENIHAIVVGKYTPKYFRELRILIRKLGIEQDIFFTGEIPNSEIPKYYSIIDILIISRINSRVTSLVTPLKPLEAMAMGKVLLTSDLPALKEMVKPKISGDLFKTEDPIDLADKILLYITRSEKRNKLEKKARDYVKNYYDWKTISKKYKILYESLLK
ncbi:MAG: glycosyltransferase family 4 protein [Candidatus Thorarchaeota archaeon]